MILLVAFNIQRLSPNDFTFILALYIVKFLLSQKIYIACLYASSINSLHQPLGFYFSVISSFIYIKSCDSLHKKIVTELGVGHQWDDSFILKTWIM